MNKIACVLLLLLVLAASTPTLDGRSKLVSSVARSHSTPDSPGFVTDDSEVVIRDGWVQEGPPSQTITAAFMVIENHTGAAISLQSASTDIAQVVELHKMELKDGMMKMHKVELIEIPAGGSVELKPGGYHLMVIGLKKTLKDGDKVTIALQFSADIRKTITIPVRPRSAMVKEG